MPSRIMLQRQDLFGKVRQQQAMTGKEIR